MKYWLKMIPHLHMCNTFEHLAKNRQYCDLSIIRFVQDAVFLVKGCDLTVLPCIRDLRSCDDRIY